MNYMPEETNTTNYLEGVSAFQSARVRAFWDEALALVRGKPAELLSFDDIRMRLRLREENYRGLQEVPLDQIAGSVGRYREFTSKFLPKQNKMQERWSRVYAQASGMTGLPPIELYKVGDVYFVRDGNHRVSVARQLGSKTIQAHVTELPTSIALKPGMSEEELANVTAYAQFLDITRLPYTRPHHQSMMLSEISRYDDLLGHVNLHRSVMESSEGHPVTIEDAAADWYDNVYRPAVTLIRKFDMLKYMPKRTEGDLYLWMIDHLRDVREAYGEHIGAHGFSGALVDFLKERHMPVPRALLAEKDDTVTLARANIERELEEYRARIESEQDMMLD
ncbi:MAG TPA: hypothetical protein VHD90_09360 [Phototrophicaceae bacterium]|nr:hypothetical protein [Phototrophicaceae bacterium]